MEESIYFGKQYTCGYILFNNGDISRVDVLFSVERGNIHKKSNITTERKILILLILISSKNLIQLNVCKYHKEH